jgi:excisionase family DNA binding protein
VNVIQQMLGNIGRTTIYKLIGEGKLKRVNIGNRAFITNESVHNYLAELENESAQEKAPKNETDS